MILNKIIKSYPDEEFLIADGFDEAVIGVDIKSMRLIYSIKKCIEILIYKGMNEDNAQEYFEYNVSGSHMGTKTPIWCDDIFYPTLTEIRKEKLQKIKK